MPLLKREIEISPLNLFELAEADHPWWVAHTRSRQEKALARYLLPLGVPFYLPQREKKIRRASRNLVSHLPLFPGYVFFRGSVGQRQAALRSRLLVQVLEVPNQPLLQRELAQLYVLQQSGANFLPYEEFRSGDPVRVVEGPFQGYSGVVIRPKARLRLMVSITMLRKTVAVELDREVLASSPPSHRSRGEKQSAVA
jgi:transcription termination/antitermination protein NusG